MNRPETVLPEGAVTSKLELRRWSADDVLEFDRIIATSVEHLRPWMPWIAYEPQTLEQRHQLLTTWEAEWAEGGRVHMGIFVHGEAVGGASLHRRGEAMLEMGYWLHPDHTGQGIATHAARVLTELAFTVPGIETVLIRHDQANQASGAIPARLGFELIGETEEDLEAPAASGIVCLWQMDRQRWPSVQS